MLKVLIVDDEKNAREALAQLITMYGSDVKLMPAADSVSSAVKAIHEHQPDVVLLDVEIKEGTGFDVLRQFQNFPFKVIFITAFQQHAVEAFRFSALDYLLKPVDPDLLVESLAKAKSRISNDKMALALDSFLFNIDPHSKSQKKIVLKTSTDMHVVNLQDVIYCEADGNYTKFYLNDKSRIMVSNTLGSYEELFADFGFLRIHSSFLANINHVKRYEKGEGGKLFLTGDIELPVATRKKEQLTQYLSRM